MAQSQSARQIDPMKLVLAVLFEIVVIGLGTYGYLETDNVMILVVAALVGSVAPLWVVFTAPRASERGSVVQEGRRKR